MIKNKNKEKNKKARTRIAVFRSNRYIYAQIIDDKKGQTLVSASNLKTKKGKGKIQEAQSVGEDLAKKALLKGIKDTFFDRRKYKYHGRVKALAEGARKGGLNF